MLYRLPQISISVPSIECRRIGIGPCTKLLVAMGNGVEELEWMAFVSTSDRFSSSLLLFTDNSLILAHRIVARVTEKLFKQQSFSLGVSFSMANEV